MINLSEERILDFLDGRLATPDEEELLHTLAVSPERRQLLRTHMKLREVTSTLARQDRFAVPERVTNQLFGRLEEAGFTPAPSPDAMLARAPQSFSMPAASSMGVASSMRVAGAAAGAAVATGLSAGWRFGAMGLLAASVMSFVLGAGAYYVFGSSLGLRTHSQEIAALHHATKQHATQDLATQYAAPQEIAEEPVRSAGNSLAESNTNLAVSLPIGPIGHIGPMENSGMEPIVNSGMKPMVINAGALPNNSPTPPASSSDLAENGNVQPIGYTAPKENPFTMESDQLRYLNSPAPIWPNATPSPLANDRGIISVRYGTGQAPSSTNSPMSSLNEFGFTWTMWNYVVARASMGQMRSYERIAQVSGTSKGNEVSTPESQTPISTTMIGGEAGVTLDPLGVPIDAMVGIMYSGSGSPDYSPFYERASLMVHFEPWKMLEISTGLEGLLYTHYLGNSIAHQENFYSLPASAVSSQALKSETCGLVGPALEIGWHF